jgi:hypothetical protein
MYLSIHICSCKYYHRHHQDVQVDHTAHMDKGGGNKDLSLSLEGLEGQITLRGQPTDLSNGRKQYRNNNHHNNNNNSNNK